MSADQRVFWRSDTCCVWVSYGEDGALVFTRERTWLDDHGIERGFRCH